MRYLLTIIAFLTAFSVSAQEYDTVPPYKKSPFIPAFALQLTDSSWFTNGHIPKNKPVIITYFNPDCGHCQLEAKEIHDNQEKFKNAFLVFVSFQPLDQIAGFASQYKLDKLPNVRFGRDPKYFLPSFYRVEFTPYNALYDKNGDLYKVYPTGMDVKEVTNWLSKIK